MAGAGIRYFKHPKIGRNPQREDKVPFRQHWPLALKNKVSTRNQKNPEVACIKEVLSFLTCLKDNDNNHRACTSQADAMQKCYGGYLKNKEETKKLEKASGSFFPGKSMKDMNNVQINKFLAQFPHKLKRLKL